MNACSRMADMSSRRDDRPILQQLERGAPPDCIHSILSFAGARTTATLSQANQFWRFFGENEMVWESFCESLDKPRGSSSWKESYLETIHVPQDIPTLEAAVKFCNAEFRRAADNNIPQKHMTIVLQRDRIYELNEPLIIEAVGEKACLTIDTLVDEDGDDRMDDCSDSDRHSLESGSSLAYYQSRIVLDTLVENQPLIQVSHGRLDLKNAKLEHCSPIGDLANLRQSRNAAILIQPTDHSRTESKPEVILDNVVLICCSGRGILNRSNANVVMENSQVIQFW